MMTIPATTALLPAIIAIIAGIGACGALLSAAMIGAGIGAGIAALAQIYVLSQYQRGVPPVR